MPIIEIGGEKINYLIVNRGILKRRKIILFIHRTGGSHFVWNY